MKSAATRATACSTCRCGAAACRAILDADHSPQWEQPARFNQLLREFVEALS